MSIPFEELGILQSAEEIADEIWRLAITWEQFARDGVGQQMTRAVDSIGANIAESYGRFHYGEKLQFLYYARGSLFETKYWLNRAKSRDLIIAPVHEELAKKLTIIQYLRQLSRERVHGERMDTPKSRDLS